MEGNARLSQSPLQRWNLAAALAVGTNLLSRRHDQAFVLSSQSLFLSEKPTLVLLACLKTQLLKTDQYWGAKGVCVRRPCSRTHSSLEQERVLIVNLLSELNSAFSMTSPPAVPKGLWREGRRYTSAALCFWRLQGTHRVCQTFSRLPCQARENHVLTAFTFRSPASSAAVLSA